MRGSTEGSFWRRVWDPEDLEEELFIDLLPFLLAGHRQQIVGQVHEQAHVAGGVLALA